MSVSWWSRWMKFNGAGLLGVGVQTGVLALLSALGVPYLAATVVAVEAAILHNFHWHERWTWRERAAQAPHHAGRRWLRFHLANGVISLLGNALLMWWLVGVLGGPVLFSNLVAIVLCGTANFIAGDLFVFALPPGDGRPQPGGGAS